MSHVVGISPVSPLWLEIKIKIWTQKKVEPETKICCLVQWWGVDPVGTKSQKRTENVSTSCLKDQIQKKGKTRGPGETNSSDEIIFVKRQAKGGHFLAKRWALDRQKDDLNTSFVICLLFCDLVHVQVVN